jgi:phospholipid/cholesterol/gamma-HCH transport system substrate-binding protein
MRRLLATAALAATLLVLLVLGVGAGEEGGGYRIRAIFDNVAAAVPGEDVKVAGARVGRIESMDVTEDNKAAVTLRIDDERFTPFHGDARCRIRPQSLIGEKFVECEPGTSSEAPLRRIRRGDGKEEYGLPLTRTSSEVDLDLVNDIMRLPYRQRFAILLAELGTGLAGRGEDLNEVIHRANPALRQTDRVLAILARQNRVLARLAEDSDTALAPLAREKKHVSGFVRQANATGQATAERRSDISAGIQRLPRFLRQLRAYMADLGSVADQSEPVFHDLRRSGPEVSRLIAELGPFARAARPSFRSLGRATARGRPALIRARPVVRDLRRFGRDAAPTSRNLDRLTASLDATEAIPRLLRTLFYSATSTNGFDDVGHYLRADLVGNVCSDYSTTLSTGCRSTFSGAAASSPAAGVAGEAGVRLVPPEAPELAGAEVPPLQPLSSLPGTKNPAAQAERERNLARIRRQARRPSPSLRRLDDPLLQYLLEDGR